MEDTWFVCSVILTGLCISTVVTELCPDQSNTPAVHFCVNSTAELRQSIHIGTEKAPKYANNNCTCTITALNVRGKVSVNLKQIPDTANISFVHEDGSATVISRDSTIAIDITGFVHVIYQTADSYEDPICLKLDAFIGTFRVSCARPTLFIDTNTPDTSPTITDITKASSIEKDIKDTTTTSTSSPAINNSTEKAITKNKEDHTVIMGPIIGGMCALIAVIAIPTIVIVIIIRRKKRKHNTPRDPVPRIEGRTAGNNTYDDLDHQNPTNNVNTEYCHIANRSGEVNASYENTGEVNASYENTGI